MADCSTPEETPSSHRNSSVNTNAESNFKTPICVWVQRLSGNEQSACAVMRLKTHVIYHMKQSFKLDDLNDE